jgi:hypothetical protein
MMFLTLLPVFSIIIPVMVDPINHALETAHQKLNQLLSDRGRIDKEIVDWKRVIDSLLAVSASDIDDPSDVEVSAFVNDKPGKTTIKFTDGVRMVLRQNASPNMSISVPEIREQLINLGFNFAKYAQPLVPIHNTLKRLEEQGEVRPLKNEMGQTLGYTWISPIERALNDDSSGNLLLRNIGYHGDIDRSKLPPDIAASLYGGNAPGATKSQSLPRGRSRLAEHFRAISDRDKKSGS